MHGAQAGVSASAQSQHEGAPATSGASAAAGPSHAPQQQRQQQQQQLILSKLAAVFTPEQISQLRLQLAVFQLVQSNKPLPPQLQRAVFDNQVEAQKYDSLVNAFRAIAQRDRDAAASGAVASTSSSAQQQQQQQHEQHGDGAAAADALATVSDTQLAALVRPYNAFVPPQDHYVAHSRDAARLPLMPTLLPTGLDANSLAHERERFIRARVNQRIGQLGQLPSTLGQGQPVADTDGDRAASGLDDDEPIPLVSQKLKALIEYKSLNLLERQRALREQVLRGFSQASSLALPADRPSLRHAKKQSIRNARITDELERKQKIDRESRVKQKHLDHLHMIVEQGRNLNMAQRSHHSKLSKLGRAVAKFHSDAEKEEQRRVERVSKERLKALRADDEESYLKLIDTAKDTRITHLLRQTDSFLESLASAVQAQQADASVVETSIVEAGGTLASADEPADESRFGAAPVFSEETKDKVDYYNVAHRVKEQITEQPSILVGGELKQYQLKGLEWMVSLYNNHVNGILADEMGLGKTIQTIALITFLIEKKRQDGPYLIIVPLSTLPNWSLEFEKWAPSVRVVSYKGTPAQRKQAAHEIRQANFQVLLTTFEYIIKDRPLLAKTKWLHMIIDEGHRMKNTQSRLSQTLTQFYSSRYRLILTGTPLQNNLPELWALLNFALPKVFGSVKSFDEWFNAPFANTGGQDKIEINEEESLLIIRRLHKVLRPFLLRRLKKDVESDLPDKVERVIKCKMSALQLKLTRQIKEHGMIFTEMGLDAKAKATGIRGLQNQIMQLRKVCNHPFTFEAVERSLSMSGINDPLLYRVAGKFEVLDRILPKLFRTGHRVLIFFQMTTVMTIFEDYLNFRRIEYLRLDGTTKHEDRATLLKSFNAPDSRYPIFMLSTRAGGLGLNLQTADTVIIFDSDWNPHQDLQAQDRAHRIGQKKEVRILRLITERSVEEHVIEGATRKIDMDKKIIQAGKYDNKSTAEERDEYLRSLLEVDEEQPEDDDELDEFEALNEAVARNDEERAIFTKMDRDRRAAEEHAWRANGNTSKLPERLMQEYELPQVYRMEHTVAKKEDDDESGERRRRTTVHYDDGLSEEQWLRALEDEEVDVQDEIDKKRARRDKRAANKVARARSGMRDSPAVGSDASTSRRRVIADSEDDEDDDDDDDTPGAEGPSRKRKRGRQSVAPSVTPSMDEDEDDQRQKRRKVASTQPDSLRERMKSIMDECLDAVDDVDNPMGHQSSGLFQTLPDRKLYPDYYQLIHKPISMSQIKRKIDRNQYNNLNDFREDFYLMIRNAKTYNEETSPVFEDAGLMLAAFDDRYNKLVQGTEVPDGYDANGMEGV